MNLFDIVREVRRHLEESGRLSLRMLRRQFELDDDALEEVIEELVDVQGVARRDGNVLEWAGAAAPSAPSAPSASTAAPEGASRDAAPSNASTQIRQSSPALAGERKIVTIVFADLAGSTALQERLDAESARVFMQRYYEAMRSAVAAHGGIVAKLLGDGVLAVFGTPRVAEDDAPRAVHAAFAMHTAFRELAEEHTALVGAIGLRVAVNTGEVIASGDAEIVGDPVNVAARLQEQCGNGEIVVGEATHRLVSQLVTLSPLGSLALKGRAGTVKAYRVESLERPSGVIQAQFVGRDDEIARMRAVFDHAVSKPATAITVLLGSPGLGKSRLIDEFSERLAHTAHVVSAHCNEASSATFAPLVLALRAFLEIDSSASADEARTAIEAAIPGEDAERARIAKGIAALFAGSPSSPEETFFVVRRFFAAVATARPVILIIDDLQWAEPMLLDLIEHLVEWGSKVPMLVLVGARPELRAKRSSLVSSGGFVADVVTLAGLDAGAAMRLAANVIGASDLPAAVAAKVLATSEGNPLFVGELVRMLVHEGALKKEGDRWTTGTALAALEMPPTIHALLAARIERLQPAERIVLERAAVVGRHFSRSAVAELLPGDVADLDARLESLQHSELIQRDTGWFLGEPVLRFHHVLIRDAAYRQLLKGTRAELHSRFADWVQERAGDSVDHDETIGWHLEQAHILLGELGPIDADGRAIGERASKHLSAAGRRALAGDDVSLAASLLGRAIKRLDAKDSARSELALDWCEALLAAGDVATAMEAIDELDRFVGDSERLRAWHTCFAGQHTVLTAPKDLEGTANAVAAAAEALADLQDPAGEAKAHFVHALALASLGRIGACEAALDRALAAARRVAGDKRRANTVLAVAPLAALWGPSPVTRASGRCLDVVRVLRITQGAPAVEAVALSCQGVLEALRGRTDAARRMIASSREMVEELGITQRLLEVDVCSGLVDLLEGDAVSAEGSLRRAYDGMRELGLGIDAARAAALLARALLALDEAAEAETLSCESEGLAGDDLKAAIAWRGVRAEALARRGEHAAAVEFANKAVEIAAATDALLDHADARLALAAALRAAGRGHDADAEEHRAQELWEAKGASLLAERARTGAAPVAPVSAPTFPELARTVRPNAATATAARLTEKIAAREVADLPSMFSEDYQEIDHSTGTVFGRDASLSSLQSLLRSDNPYLNLDSLASLGSSVALVRRRSGARGTDSGRYDVGPYETEAIHVMAVDDAGRFTCMEVFAADRLDEAIACLYERYAALQPEGAMRERARATQRSIAAVLTASDDVDRMASVLVADFESVDHRPLRTWSMRGVDAYIEHMNALLAVADDIDIRAVDVLALEANALLIRRLHSGTEHVGGGAYERAFLALFVTDDDGRFIRAEWFAEDQAAQALARFEELTAPTQSQYPVEPHVQPNMASAIVDRTEAAREAQDADALAADLSDSFVYVHHATGTSYGHDGYIGQWKAAFAAERFDRVTKLLGTLGDNLAISRSWTSVAGLKDRAFEDFGPTTHDIFVVVEAGENGLCDRIEVFDAERAANALTHLYARHAELLPVGADRDRATTTARVFAEVIGTQPDVDVMAALAAPNFEFLDRRTLGFGSIRGIDGLRGYVSAYVQEEDAELNVGEIFALRQDIALIRTVTVGTSRTSGGAYERPMLQLWTFAADGRLSRMEQFDSDNEAEAFARYDELVGGRASHNLRERFENAAARADRELFERFDARDWAGIEALAAPGLVFDERRRIARNTCGRDIWLEQFRVLFDVPESRFTTELDATRGQHLALNLHRFTGMVRDGGGPLEMDDHWVLHEVDNRGCIIAIVLFDLEDKDAAYGELDARYEAGEAKAHANNWSCVKAFTDRVAARDWDGVAALCADEFVEYDHRSLAVLGTTRGAEAWVNNFKTLAGLSTELVYRNHHFLPEARGYYVHGGWYGHQEGGDYELPLIAVVELDERGLIVRTDIYDDSVDAALARLAELAKPAELAPGRTPIANAAKIGRRSVEIEGSPPGPAERTAANASAETRDPRTVIANPNTASLAMDRWQAAYEIGAASDDWQPMRKLCAGDCTFEDRRRMALLSGDIELMVASARERVSIGAKVEGRFLGTAGDRIAMTRMLWAGGPPDGRFEIEYLAVAEIDEAGLFTAFVLMDLEDPRAVQTEAWRRWAAIDPDVPGVVAPIGHALDAFNTQDAAAFRAAHAPDVVVHDHRLAGMGRIDGAAAYTESVVALWKLAPITQTSNGWFWPVFDPCGGVTVLRRTGTLPEGGEFESEHLFLFLVDSGRFAHIELFELHALDKALARFEELRADPLRIPPNAATRARTRYGQTVLAAGPAAIRTLVSNDFVYEDRGRRAMVMGDVETWISSTEYVIDLPGISILTPLIATVGDRILVDHLHISGGTDDGPFEFEGRIRLLEVDEEGLLRASILFDPEDRAAAIAEAQARFLLGEAAGIPAHATITRMFQAWSDKDWDALRTLVAADIVIDDHRPLSFGRIGREEWIESWRVGAELAPDVAGNWIRLLDWNEHGRVPFMHVYGTRDGGEFENLFIGVIIADESAVTHFEWFAAEDGDRAVARFRELCSDGTEVAARTIPDTDAPVATAFDQGDVKPNAASEAVARWHDTFALCVADGDWEPLRAEYSEDAIFDDRQRHSLISGGRAMALASSRERAAVGARPQTRLLAAVGARIAIIRMLWTGGPADGRFEVEPLALIQVDTSGRIAATILFDVDDMEGARREAWQRWSAIEPEVAPHLELLTLLMEVWNSHDTTRLRSRWADDIVVEDHRLAGIGRIEGSEAYRRANEVLWELAPDQRIEFGPSLHAHGPHGMLVTLRRHGTLPDGGDFESVYLMMCIIDDGRVTHIEMFEADALDVALARFEELRPDPLRIPPNEVERALERSRGVTDIDAIRAMVSDEFVFEDRKKLSQSVGSVDDWMRSMSFLRDEACAEPVRQLLATVNDRLALHRMLWSGGPSDGRFEIEHLVVGEIDAVGRIKAIVLFDPEDRAAAHTELLERYVAAGAEGMSRGAIEFLRGFNEHDLVRARAGLTDDFVLDDHRRAGMGLVEGADRYLPSIEALYELIPDVRNDFIYFAAQADHGVVALTRRGGHNAEGGAVESLYIVLTLDRDDKLARMEFYEPEQLDEALARFEELRPRSTDSRESA